MAVRVPLKVEPISRYGGARGYARSHRKYLSHWYRKVVREIQALGIRGSYLDAGAGPGFLAAMLAQALPDVRITAIDIAADMAEVAREHFREKGLQERIQYHVADVGNAQELEKLGRHDLVYSTLSLHHWRDPGGSLRNLWQVVKPGGVLYLRDLRRCWWLYHLPLRGGFLSSVRASFTPAEIGRLLKDVGVVEWEVRSSFPWLTMTIIARK
jgi:2-polyprenyl-3-methyl-5-hydroxy-6-metoxy-1,4-benzoquinol methylase